MLMTWHCRDVVDFPLYDFDVETFMHDYLVSNCRRDDYFLCIYLNCMSYCLIRNRVLQHTPQVAMSSSHKYIHIK